MLARAVVTAVHIAAPLPLSGQTNPQPAPAGRGGAPVQGAEEDIPLVGRFDRNGDKRLDYAERLAARDYLAAHPELRSPTRGGRLTTTGTAGPPLSPNDVKPYPASVPLYDPDTLRTFFLQFDRPDWEQELEAFWHTDVEVAATLIVDGTTYRDVGVSFRGNNSFTAVPAGLKRPISLAIDFVHDQDLLGHRSLNLLNSNQDPTFLRSVLYLDVARDYLPALKANFVRVAINGESWGVYVNQQTFSKECLRETFKTTNGTRWKSPILNETSPEKLEAALSTVMDVDAVLRFLALDVALVNNDGYWRDGSDFNLYRSPEGRFLLTPHDANEGLRTGGRAGGGDQPDPLTTLDDPNKALRHKLLAVPALRDRYLKHVGDIADKWLDWNRLGPIVEKYQRLIADEVARDTHKLDTTDAFLAGIYGAGDVAPPATTLKGFADRRRAALLAHPEIQRARVTTTKSGR